ncbi:tetraspanin-33-like [Heptranchias perlo]|uniref:tetraspanin-33-like n=1 Tax=Heptranchias perlo TaxID=212740 RepID=UPI003559A980
MRTNRLIKYTLFTFCYVFWYELETLQRIREGEEYLDSLLQPSGTPRREVQDQNGVGVTDSVEKKGNPGEIENEDLQKLILSNSCLGVSGMLSSSSAKLAHFLPMEHQAVASGLMLTVGIYAKTAVEGGAMDSLTADPALILIIVGCLIFCITFLGCAGALRDIQILLRIFMWILLLILLLQVIGAMLGFIFSEKVERKSVALLEKGMIRYRDDLDLQNLIDYIQKKFKCCGVSSYKDWSKNVYFSCADTNPSLERCGVPFSCCVMDTEEVLNTMCGYETQSLKAWTARKQIYTDGCLDKIVNWGHQNLFLIAGVGLGLLFLEILMISLTVALLNQIHSIKKRIVRRATAN